MTDAKEDRTPELNLSNYHQLFLEEAHSFLDLLRRNLTQLLDAPGDRRAQSEARRAAHTLKGMAATMHYEELANLARDMENQLQQGAQLAPDQIRLLLAGCDRYEDGLEQTSSAEP